MSPVIDARAQAGCDSLSDLKKSPHNTDAGKVEGPGQQRNQCMRREKTATGFSLIELVIVVVIIGIIAAIAIPRMSRGAAGANDAALSGNLSVLRNALDLYQAEHHGDYPPATNTADHLTKHTTSSNTSTPGAKDAANGFIYGPYIKAIPLLNLPNSAGTKGLTKIAAASADDVAWIYDPATGEIRANTGARRDVSGKLYSDY